MLAIQARFVDSRAAEVRSQNVFSRNRSYSGYNRHREVTIGPVFHKKKRRKNRIYIIYMRKHRKSKNNVEQQTERRSTKENWLLLKLFPPKGG
jgi:hypothetical protein